MQRLLAIIQRFGNLILFVVLQAAALTLLITQNVYHETIFTDLSIQTSGRVNEVYASSAAYFNLEQQNILLAQENVLLHQRITQLENELQTYKFRVPLKPEFAILPDSVFPNQRFSFLPARAIAHTTQHEYNYITLDKGYMHGVVEGMGVFSSAGIAGRVIEVSRNYSLALSVLNKRFKVSAHILNNDNIGTLSWEGYDGTTATLDYIPLNFILQAGDTVVTSQYSSIFPENFYIGTVASFVENAEDGFYKIQVKLGTNFYGLDHLYLIRNNDQSELDSLDGRVTIR